MLTGTTRMFISTRGGARCRQTRQQRNKATFRRFHEAINTGDAELISKTIDEVAEPDVLIRTPLPVEATGAQALKQVTAMLHRAFPDTLVPPPRDSTGAPCSRQAASAAAAATTLLGPTTPSRTRRSLHPSAASVPPPPALSPPP